MKNIFAIVFIAVPSVAVAQKQVVSAYNANKSGDYKAAAGYIEEAITIEKAAIKDKTWRYRGEIYLNIANDSALSVEFPNALWVAKESYTKAKNWTPKATTNVKSLRDLAWYKPRRATKVLRITPLKISPGLLRNLT